jgi:DNA repair/transcription protein MET18/MMS19
MGKEFIMGYLDLAENEKDPRNLLLAFAITHVVILEFDISDFVEVCNSMLLHPHLITCPQSFFNITFCYFPITFKSPSNDPYGISDKDLRLALR